MLSSILGSSKPKQLPKIIQSAQDILDFFNKKVESVRKATGQGHAAAFLSPATSTLNVSQPYTDRSYAKVITAAPSKSCELHPIPSDIVKQFLPGLLSFITRMCNASLCTAIGLLPMSQRSAMVTRFWSSWRIQNYTDRYLATSRSCRKSPTGRCFQSCSPPKRGRSTETAVVKVSRSRC